MTTNLSEYIFLGASNLFLSGKSNVEELIKSEKSTKTDAAATLFTLFNKLELNYFLVYNDYMLITDLTRLFLICNVQKDSEYPNFSKVIYNLYRRSPKNFNFRYNDRTVTAYYIDDLTFSYESDDPTVLKVKNMYFPQLNE